jgi:hypothetical protein
MLIDAMPADGNERHSDTSPPRSCERGERDAEVSRFCKTRERKRGGTRQCDAEYVGVTCKPMQM